MKVLIALDQSECSEMVLQSIVKRRWPKDSQFKIISVFEPVVANPCVGFSAAYLPAVLIEAEQTLREERKEYVDQMVVELQKTFPDNQVAGQVADGYARDVIVEHAKHWGADLIIVGSHGRSGLSKFFLGSVAEGVVRYANCSVEIIKGHPLVDSEVA